MGKKEIYGRTENPIVIRLSHLGNVIMPINGFEEEIELDTTGVMIDNSVREHYGFIIMSDHNNRQSERVYRTDNKILDVQISDGKLRVYEENRLHPWLFSKNGKIIENNNATVNFSHKKCDLGMTPSGHLEQNDGLIKIIFDKIENKITIDANGVEFPVIPGVVFDNEYYGINIEVIKENPDSKEIETMKTSYRTEDSLYGIRAIDIGHCHDNDSSLKFEYKLDEIEVVRVYEREKYHPWEFTCMGELVQKSSYNIYSRRDMDAYEDKYGERLTKGVNNR